MTIPTSLDAFKDVCKRWRSKSLFLEFINPDYPAFYTLAEEDKVVGGVTYLSAKRKYLEYKDPTEHKFARACFGSYQCWKAVCSSPDLKPYVEEWRQELDLLLRSIGIDALRAKAESGDVQAAKALASGSYASAKNRSPGRPGKTRNDEAGDTSGGEHTDAFKRLFPSPTSPSIPLTPTPPFTVTSNHDDEHNDIFN